MLRKYFLSLVTLLLFFSNGAWASLPSINVIFKLEKNNADKTYLATITLKNNSAKPIEHWQLAFTSIREITKIQEGSLLKREGYYYEIAPQNGKRGILPAHSEYVFHVQGSWGIKHVTDAPTGYFLILTQPVKHTLSLDAKTILSLSQHAESEDDLTVDTTAATSANQSLVIPLPAQLEQTSGTFTLRGDTVILFNTDTAKNAADFFLQAIKPASGFQLRAKQQSVSQPQNNAIIFIKSVKDDELGAEGYLLNVTPDRITIRANAGAGFFYAVQTLRQLLPPAIFSRHLQHADWTIPCLTIRDYPRFAYRGLLLDTARHFMPIPDVKRLIDLMAIYKLNRFQWHLTDDEGWRIEIKKYPALTAIGAWRGYHQKISPALGSGAKRYGGYYSQADIRDIIKYASARHVTIIPEIDVPGHARAMLRSLPNLLIDKADKSNYTSVQGYHDNVLSPCIESTYTVIDNILSEVAKIFPAETIHVGSDEVPDGVWLQSPRCQKIMKAHNLKTKAELQHYFLMRVKKIIAEKNKKMAVWNDANINNQLDNTTVIYAWTSAKAGYIAAKQGHTVVLMPAANLYFDMAYNANPLEPGFYWAGLVNTFKVYSYQPIDSTWSAEITQKISGVQAAVWTENISSVSQLDYFTFPKLLALSEVAWTPQNKRDWRNFSERVRSSHLQLLDYYGVNYRHAPK